MNNSLPLTYGDVFCVKKRRILAFLCTRLSTLNCSNHCSIAAECRQKTRKKQDQLFVECALLFLLDKVDEYKRWTADVLKTGYWSFFMLCIATFHHLIAFLRQYQISKIVSSNFAFIQDISWNIVKLLIGQICKLHFILGMTLMWTYCKDAKFL